MGAERIHLLNAAPVKEGRYVIYRMQASRRLQCNLALCRKLTGKMSYFMDKS